MERKIGIARTTLDKSMSADTIAEKFFNQDLAELIAENENISEEKAKAKASKLQGLMDKDYEITKRIAKELGIEEFGTACDKATRRFRRPIVITTNSSRRPKEEK